MPEQTTQGIHPIGGVGVPHAGCFCRNCEDARPLIEGKTTGLWALLTPEQKKTALTYRGDETIGVWPMADQTETTDRAAYKARLEDMIEQEATEAVSRKPITLGPLPPDQVEYLERIRERSKLTPEQMNRRIGR